MINHSHNFKPFFIVLVFILCVGKLSAQKIINNHTTEIHYLSGTDKDHMVEWEFTVQKV